VEEEHPKATFGEIEAAVDERVNQLRAQLIEDVVFWVHFCLDFGVYHTD